MAKELAWICGIIPASENQRIVGLCQELNRSVGLPENVFRFPLHISMKKSFNTNDFEAVRTRLVELLRQHGTLECQTGEVTLHRNMIWLPIVKTPTVLRLHSMIDELLLKEFSIPQDRFDKDFNPHVSLFTSGDSRLIQEMFEMLKDELRQTMSISRFVIGSSGHRDVFYDMG